MGKPNNQKKKKNNNGYFQRNVQQNGPNFLMKKTARDILFDFRNIFKDIAYSDPEDHIPKLVDYFVNFTFICNLVNSAYHELQVANATAIGLQMYVAAVQRGEMPPIDPNAGIYEHLVLVQNQVAAYSIISAHLNNIVSLFNCSADDDWLKMNIEAQLKSLSLQLAKYKRII